MKRLIRGGKAKVLAVILVLGAVAAGGAVAFSAQAGKEFLVPFPPHRS